MAEKVEIKGGDLDGSILQNAASEATLVRLVELIEKQNVGGRTGAGSMSAAAQQTNRLQELYNKSLKTSDKELNTLEKSTKKASGALTNLAKDAAGLLKGLINTIDKTVSSGLSLAFSSATPKITELTDVLGNALGPVGGTIRVFGTLLQETITDFKDLSQSGADLGSSLLDVKRRAVEAGLSVENFKKVVVDNSAGLATLGGTVGQGAARFAKINGALEKQFGPALSRLGIGMDEAAENTASYLVLQQRLGRLSSMSTDQITQGAMKYNLELDKLARATGVQRKEIEKNNQSLQTEARFKATLAKLTAEQQVAISAEITKLDKLDSSGRLSKAFKDIIGSGGNLLTREAQMLAMDMKRAGVDITKIGREIFEGNADAIKEITPAFARLGELGLKLADSQRILVAVSETQGTLVPNTYAVLSKGIQDTAKNVQEAGAEQSAAINSAGKNMADVDRVLQNTKNSLNTALMPLLEGLNQAGGNLLTQLQPGGPLLSGIEQYSKGVADYLSNFLSVLSAQGPGEAFSMLWSDLTTHGKPYIEQMFKDFGEFFKQQVQPMLIPFAQALAAGTLALFTSPPVLAVMVAGISLLFGSKILIGTAVGLFSSLVKNIWTAVKSGLAGLLAKPTGLQNWQSSMPQGPSSPIGGKPGMGKNLIKLGKAGLKFLPGVGLIMGAGDAAMAAWNAEDTLGIQPDETGQRRSATSGERLVAGTAGLLSAATLGVISANTIAKGLASVTGVGPTTAAAPVAQQPTTSINSQARMLEREQMSELSETITESGNRTVQATKSQIEQSSKLEVSQNLQTESLNSSVTQLTELNNRIAELITLQKQANEIAKDIENAAKRNPSNMANGGRVTA